MGACSRPITSFLNVRLTWTYGCYYSKHILDVKCLFPRLEYMDRNVTKARTAAEGMHEQRPSRRYLGLGLAVSDCCLRGAGARNVSRPVLPPAIAVSRLTSAPTIIRQKPARSRRPGMMFLNEHVTSSSSVDAVQLSPASRRALRGFSQPASRRPRRPFRRPDLHQGGRHRCQRTELRLPTLSGRR